MVPGIHILPGSVRFRSLIIFLFSAALAFAPGSLSATVNSGEIIPGSASATVSPIIDPVNGVTVVFRWTTVHPSNSYVMIENSTDYATNGNQSVRQISNPAITTNHVVSVDHFFAYQYYPTWGYYVASEQSNGTWASYPGPGSYLSFNLPTTPNNPNGPLIFTMWPIGGQNVYQGDPTQSPACTPFTKNSRECNDLYIALQANLLSGPDDGVVVMRNVVITNTDTGRPVTNFSVTAQYLCDLSAPSNPPPPGWDGSYREEGICYNGTVYNINTTLRIRANSKAVPGHYSFSGQFQAQEDGQNDGNPVNVTYNFTVLPTASFAPTAPSSYPPIPNRSTWETNMVNPNSPDASGEYWCTNNNDTNPWWSLDNGSFVGYFDMPSSIYFEAWNYDGGRVYQQIADYDYNVSNMPGYLNVNQRTHWKRCAELAMEPYKDTVIATQASFLQEPNQFAYGMAMNNLRTGDPTMLAAVNWLANNPTFSSEVGNAAYVAGDRTITYTLDSRLAAEILGVPRSLFTPRTVDLLLGVLDQTYNLNFSNPNQQQYDTHPFIIGLVMETLINYYEIDIAEGHTPDARIPLEIKKTLDWLWSTQYVPSTHAMAYQPYELPWSPSLVGGTQFEATELNDLLAPAYAWIWSKTGNNTYLTEGDVLFQHVWDSAGGQIEGGDGGWTWSVKEFNQIYKWSFDYVRWRSGQNPDGSSPAIPSVLAAANPCENHTSPCNAPWTDWKPAQNQYQDHPSMNPAISAPTVTSSSATFTFNTFKPATTTIYYGFSRPATCNLGNPQPPYCMSPFPNFGFQAMMAASYWFHSSPVAAVKNNNTPNQWDPVGAPNVYNTTVTITGLVPNTTYHWRPLVVDNNGNMAAFADQTFTTAAGSGGGGIGPTPLPVSTNPKTD
jgi:hypothetical protein